MNNYVHARRNHSSHKKFVLERELNKNTKFPIEIDNPPKKWKIVKEVGGDQIDKGFIYYVP